MLKEGAKDDALREALLAAIVNPGSKLAKDIDVVKKETVATVAKCVRNFMVRSIKCYNLQASIVS